MEEDRGETVRPRRHPYGRVATLRWAWWEFASGLVTMLSLGAVTPRWALDSVFKSAHKALARKADNGGSTSKGTPC